MLQQPNTSGSCPGVNFAAFWVPRRWFRRGRLVVVERGETSA
jgi:hypothetical protein